MSTTTTVHVATAVVIAATSILAAVTMRYSVNRRLRQAGAAPDTGTLPANVAFYFILFFGLVAALSVIDFDFAAIGLEASLLGVGIGFALKDILTNFASGMMIIASRPFVAGDQIQFKDMEGTVESVNWRSTILKTYDGRRVIIPNTDVFSNSIINNTAFALRRSSIFIGVGLLVDLTSAAQIALAALQQLPEVATEPAPEVLVKDAGDFAVKLEIRIWTDSQHAQWLRANSLATQAIKEAYDRNGIDMPFPTQVVLLKNEAS